MPLDGRQIERLAAMIDCEWDLPTLTIFVKDKLDVDLVNQAPEGPLKQRAKALILNLNKSRPPRDGELLEKLRECPNAALRAVAAELLNPDYFSPTGDPLDAIVLGRAAFVDRQPLRDVVREFTAPSPFTTHVLLVRGNAPCGKSYSWEFLRHLARNVAGVIPQRLRLMQTDYSPRQFIEQVFRLLGLPTSEIPTMTDDPQQAHIGPLVNAFKGQIVTLQKPYWLVIDDLNDKNVSNLVRECAYALAAAVEENKPPDLWIALLGYNEQITDAELRFVAQEDALFPDADGLARHFVHMAEASPVPLAPLRARQIADVLLAKFPQLNKEAMTRLTPLVEVMGEKLRRGEQP